MAKGTIKGFILGVITTIVVINAPSFIDDLYVDSKISYYMSQADALEFIGAKDSAHIAHDDYVLYINTIDSLQQQ